MVSIRFGQPNSSWAWISEYSMRTLKKSRDRVIVTVTLLDDIDIDNYSPVRITIKILRLK